MCERETAPRLGLTNTDITQFNAQLNSTLHRDMVSKNEYLLNLFIKTGI